MNSNNNAPAMQGEGVIEEIVPSSYIVTADADEIRQREARVDALVAKVERSLQRARVLETLAVFEALGLLALIVLIVLVAR